MEAIAAKTLYFEDLSVGMEASIVRLVTDSEIRAFAAVTGDSNPLHLDEDFAATTPFKRRIAHGMLGAAFISAVFSSRLPGPGAVYISQTLNFRAPVNLDDNVTVTVRLTDLIEAKKRAVFACEAKVGERIVIEGQAVIMVPSRLAK